MKQCPQCGTEYNDSVNFCRKDGRSLIAKVAAPTRLCPHCANSIADDAERCPYCKAEVGSVSTPQWPQREESPAAARSVAVQPRPPRAGKTVLAAGVVLCAIGLFLIGGNLFGRSQRSESHALLETKIKEVEERDQKIQSLENQLAQLPQGSADKPKEPTALKTKLEETQKELSTTQQRLNSVTRELSENATDRAALKTKLEQSQKELAALQVRLDIATRELNRTAARSQPGTPVPQKTAEPSQKPAEPSKKGAEPSPPAQARRVAEPGTYQTTRTTDVHEEASASSPVIARIGKGTILTVVRSVGDWLEVRSKHGKPPGFIRRDDAMYVSSAN